LCTVVGMVTAPNVNCIRLEPNSFKSMIKNTGKSFYTVIIASLLLFMPALACASHNDPQLSRGTPYSSQVAPTIINNGTNWNNGWECGPATPYTSQGEHTQNTNGTTSVATIAPVLPTTPQTQPNIYTVICAAAAVTVFLSLKIKIGPKGIVIEFKLFGVVRNFIDAKSRNRRQARSPK
jgi:hypothetical protein